MEQIIFHALENRVDKGMVTFGAPWEKGKVDKNTAFELEDNLGNRIQVQSRITAFWPDGSIKWSAHTCRITGEAPYLLKTLVKSDEAIVTEGIKITTTEQGIKVDAGSTKAWFTKNSDRVIDNVFIDNRLSVNFGKLIYINEERKEEEESRVITETDYVGKVKEVTVEDVGSLQCTIRVDGVHQYKNKEIIPFILRFTFAYNEDYIKILHTFIYDGEPNVNYMKAIGITFDCPMDGELYNRHIKIAGENGNFHEALQLLVSWRPRIPEDIYPLQNEGYILEKDKMSEEAVQKALKDITIWDKYRIYQDSARHYSIKKGTDKNNCCLIDCIQGSRALGVLAISGESGGIAIGSRHFWEKYPSSIWVEGMSKESAKVTAWIWSYEHEAMDFRHYDTVGHASAYYEGFDEVGSTPYGIANTNEFVLYGYASNIPEDAKIKEFSDYVNHPPMLKASPEYYKKVEAFGEWSLVRRDNTFTSWIEDQLDKIFEFYKKEVEQREWYGLFNYGDFMHTYDSKRHNWRYDMGGYAWQNTELVPTLWLWYAYLRSGREDIFTIAEAMTRHCSEVDIYHMGDYKGLGSRHNVLHWGCSCKEPRIAMAGHHRFYYYLTGDFRLGDVFDDVVDADYATLNIDPLRYFYDKESMVYKTHARTGPDWSSYCSNWMASWERTGDIRYKDKILVGINDIKKSPYRLISGSDYEYCPESGHLRYIGENAGGGSHLAICMGSPQTWFELANLLEDDEWKDMLAEYGDFYFASNDEKAKRAPGVKSSGFAFPYMAAAMGAYGARHYKNAGLGEKVFRVLQEEMERNTGKSGVQTKEITTYLNTDKLEEIPWISTNVSAQWCLNAIMALELAKDYIPQDL